MELPAIEANITKANGIIFKTLEAVDEVIATPVAKESISSFESLPIVSFKGVIVPEE